MCVHHVLLLHRAVAEVPIVAAALLRVSTIVQAVQAFRVSVAHHRAEVQCQELQEVVLFHVAVHAVEACENIFFTIGLI